MRLSVLKARLSPVAFGFKLVMLRPVSAAQARSLRTV